MKRFIVHIIYLTLGILLVALTVTDVVAQRLQVNQCETIEFSVVDVPGDRYTWALYRDSTVNFAQVDGDVDPVAYFADNGNPPRYYEGSTVFVNWLEPGTYMLRVMVWDEVLCTNNLKMFIIDVLDNPPEAILEGDSVCIGETAIVKIILTGKGPWDVTYTYGDGTDIINLNGIVEDEYNVPIPMLPVGTTDFWIMEVSDDCVVNSYVADPQKIGVLIYPKPAGSKIYLKE